MGGVREMENRIRRNRVGKSRSIDRHQVRTMEEEEDERFVLSDFLLLSSPRGTRRRWSRGGDLDDTELWCMSLWLSRGVWQGNGCSVANNRRRGRVGNESAAASAAKMEGIRDSLCPDRWVVHGDTIKEGEEERDAAAAAGNTCPQLPFRHIKTNSKEIEFVGYCGSMNKIKKNRNRRTSSSASSSSSSLCV